MIILFRFFLCSLSLLLGSHATAETITIGAEDGWYPYSGVVQGEARGFTVDLVRAVFAAGGVDVIFQPMPYSRCMSLVKSGHLLACFDTTRASIVEADYLWHSKPMFTSRTMVYARAENAARNVGIQQLEGKRVIVTNGYEYGDVFDLNTKVLRDVSMDDISGLRKLIAGRAEYALVFEKVATLIIKEHPEEFAGIIPVGVLQESSLYTAFSKTYPDSSHYVKIFNQGFSIVSKNGTLHELERKWK